MHRGTDLISVPRDCQEAPEVTVVLENRERFIFDTYDGQKPVTIGVDFHSKNVTLSDSTAIRASFWASLLFLASM
nr:unnamed protein product [Spirometra erinaceieuropaei]